VRATHELQVDPRHARCQRHSVLALY
jgi:hypothetical protein